MKIHHGVAKKAAKHNIELHEQPDGTWTWTHADLGTAISEANPKAALAAAMRALGYKKPKSSGKRVRAKKAAVIQNKSVVRKEYKAQYAKSTTGQGNGDRLDVAMKDGLEGDPDALRKIAKSNNVPFVWQALNPGLQRMNLTNVLRARVKRGEKVDILGKTVASL